MLKNPEIAAHVEKLSAHPDLGSEVLSAIRKLGDCEVRYGSCNYPALYVVTRNVVFCAASGMGSTFWRLRSNDVVIALRTGAEPAEYGPEWVELRLFQQGWPKLDLSHWAIRAYDFARTGD